MLQTALDTEEEIKYFTRKERTNMQFSVKELEEKDKKEFLTIAEIFFKESYHKAGTIRLDKFWHQIKQTFKHKNVSIPCVCFEGKIIGYAIINYNTEFKDEKEGDLSKLYILPEYRKTGASRVLAQVVIDIFDEWGCEDSHIWAAPQLEGNNQNIALFRNLWLKYGYVETGIIMTRKRGK